MPWSHGLGRFAFLLLLGGVAGWAETSPDNAALWREFGLVEQTSAKLGAADLSLYRMKDLTGALAAWEWQRTPTSKPCTLQAFCSFDGKRSTIISGNYFVSISGPVQAPALNAFLQALPKRRETALPSILNYLPRQNLVPNSARYALGQVGLAAFAPALAHVQAGFDQGAEAQLAEYKTGAAPLRLAIFYYPTPEMARIHFAHLKRLPGVQVSRSAVLVAVVFGDYSPASAAAILDRIAFEAKVTWNDIPPPNPIKPLYQLLWNIIFLSGLLVSLCLLSGLIYAGIRLYRRRFGTLEEDEAMTTLHLSR